MNEEKIKERKINKKSHITLYTSNNKGITLVALIITIIVLLILAVVAIRAISNDGIISKAKEAQTKTEEAQVDEQAKLEEYLGEIESNIPNKSGTVGKWVQNKTSVERTNEDGTITKLTVGAVVGEDVTVNGELPTLYGGNKWAVLGAENGKLLLTTTKNITDSTGAVKKATFSGNDDYYKTEILTLADGVSTTETTVIDMSKVTPVFDKVIEDCGITITDTVAEGVRSINVDDINRVTTYNPENVGLEHNGGPYGGTSSNTKNAHEYGNIVKYKASTAIEASNGATGTTSSTCKLPRATANSEFTIKSNYYYYYPETLTDNSNRGSELRNTAWYTLLFANTNSNDTYYWLASPSVLADYGMACWDLHWVYIGGVNSRTLWCSIDGSHAPSYGVRAVVSLGYDVQVK